VDPVRQVYALADAIGSRYRYRLLILLATFTSLRWAELAALTPRHIDLNACTVRVTRQINYPPGGGHSFGPPKSRAGRRVVSFPDLIVPDLRKHLDELGADAALEGTAGGEDQKMAGFRVPGNSKDHRGDLPQIVTGMAVTRNGIPVRIWSWPGNTAGSALIRQVKDDMRDWTLARIVWVADRGFTSRANRRYLRRGDCHYIIGEKLRSGSAEAAAALSRQGRYQEITGNLRVKEVKISADERFVICHNPAGAERDAAIRARLLARLREKIDGTDKLTATKRAELRGGISTRPGLNRYLRVTPGGLLRIDAGAVKAEENLDGKYLLRASDPRLSAADIALGYRQLPEVERGWRDMKQVIDLRPACHRTEERIRAHVILCWLALLLIRIAETTAGATWNKITDELGQLTLGTFTGPAGTFRQTADLTPAQHAILSSLQIPSPKKIIQAAPAGPDQDHASAQ
jgi:hypothetical protein